MGLTGERIKSVFSKSRSISSHDCNVKSFAADRRRWSMVRSYFCADEVNSVLAEEDSASVRSSEATVTQPIKEAEIDQDIQSELLEKLVAVGKNVEQRRDSERDAAAKLIQCALRGFLVRRRFQEMQNLAKRERDEETGVPFGESGDTSTEVQTGASAEKPRLQEGSASVHSRVNQKAKTQISKLKEEWDDSTVSSNTTKLRLQNRLEAMTRRERALAYAFSQQLRTCSQKKKHNQPDSAESNLGWSWLERWMATRILESSTDERASKSQRPIYSSQPPIGSKKKIDVGGEEKESCGSNEIPVGLENVAMNGESIKDRRKPVKNRLKATRTVSRRKTVPSCQYTAPHIKVGKKDNKDKKTQQQSMGEIKCKELSQLSSAHSERKGSLVLV